MKSPLTVSNTNNSNISAYSTNSNTAEATADTQIANTFLAPGFLAGFERSSNVHYETQHVLTSPNQLLGHTSDILQTVTEVLYNADQTFDVLHLSVFPPLTPIILTTFLGSLFIKGFSSVRVPH